jgi:hypothetical protein|tara:strand:- start:8441 stop:9079 length:639 start_codon:yes stop_codon:yes gene_type:complete
MFNNNKQVGRTRVNWNHDSKKTKKTHVQQKKVNETQMDKLYQLQEQFFKEGMNSLEYRNYVQEKINDKMFYYRKLSEEDFSKLQQRYRRLVQEKENKVNELLESRKRNKRQKKLFKEKKKKIIYEQKKKMIGQLFKVISESNVQGMNKKGIGLSDDPDLWKETKKGLFAGGRYPEKADKKWIKVYQKIESPVSAHLFDFHSHDELNQHVLNC